MWGGISAGFPFWGADRPPACGIPELELRCNEKNITTMKINQVAYRVLKINREDEILRIAREDYWVGLCPPQYMNTFNPQIFEPVDGYKFYTFTYGCTDASTTIFGPKAFTCKEGENGPGELCNGSVTVPVPIKDSPPVWNTVALEEQLKKWI
ncbi:WALL-ASSOCIATED RECEPTOR KINASE GALACTURONAN-BINDING DOMAIN-CONTAINING PROTEIN-RELATED [Salix koriyanagi]|uniref:WALL-ASSOCIATED RECEPTOR KINASE GALACTURONAN-BINDING DOMAIN-CONTAINING PROTEIN-RELATED n=1 Tax=Salix koriyanagi TaxID=2511006 RepID=A0A9Q0ZZN6_9ROSI|nr:WALL-ASSOCIATED RECEPTOR KINASE GALACTURONAN-BINDING DOMAIN-CONTAINING PROTEIN-RELATED [Salix koriyanagi]